MLLAALAVLCIAVGLGLWLSSMFLIYESAPSHANRVAALHGVVGASSVALLFLTLNRPGPGSRFGSTALVVLAAALAGGLTIVSFKLRRKPVSPLLISMHACVGMAGAVMIAAYFTTHASFGR